MQTAGALEASPRPEATPAMFGSRPRGYLEIFNLFRVVACLAVIGQHAFIWTDMSDNFVGTGFITVLHLSRTCFFFLTGLVVCYAQITHPRPLLGFWPVASCQILREASNVASPKTSGWRLGLKALFTRGLTGAGALERARCSSCSVRARIWR